MYYILFLLSSIGPVFGGNTVPLTAPDIEPGTLKLIAFSSEDRSSQYDCSIESSNRDVKISYFLSSCIAFVDNRSEMSSAKLNASVSFGDGASEVKYVEIVSVDKALKESVMSKISDFVTTGADTKSIIDALVMIYKH
jgi:hypothetical protein